MPKGDKLFKYGEEGVDIESMGVCTNCNYHDTIFVLAPTQEEADTIKLKGGGLCGMCMCNNIIDTHGYVVTDPKRMAELGTHHTT